MRGPVVCCRSSQRWVLRLRLHLRNGRAAAHVLAIPTDDPIGLLVAVDGFPPTTSYAALPVGWTPTVELTAHVRGVPEPGWLRCSFSTRFVTGSYLGEDGEVWDASGRLIAQSRQLALVP